MIIIICRNGLLNRIRSILCSKIIADRLNDKLFVLWLPEQCCNCNYEDIFNINNDLWTGITSNEIDNFMEKYNLSKEVNKYPLYFNEKNGVCTLRGYNKGEQRFMEQFMNSKCEIKILIAGGNFFDPRLGFNETLKNKTLLYNKIIFNKNIEIPKVKNKTLGIHLRYTDRNKYAPTIKDIENAIKNFESKNNIDNIILVSDDIKKRSEICGILKNKFKVNIEMSKINKTHRNMKESLQYAITDWLILCKCDYLIFFTGSSFGYEAYLYNTNKKVVEIPEKKLLT